MEQGLKKVELVVRNRCSVPDAAAVVVVVVLAGCCRCCCCCSLGVVMDQLVDRASERRNKAGSSWCRDRKSRGNPPLPRFVDLKIENIIRKKIRTK